LNGSLPGEEDGEKTTSYRPDLLNRQVRVWTSDGRGQDNLYDREGLLAGFRENGKESESCSIMEKFLQSVVKMACR